MNQPRTRPQWPPNGANPPSCGGKGSLPQWPPQKGAQQLRPPGSNVHLHISFNGKGPSGQRPVSPAPSGNANMWSLPQSGHM
eukprot:1982150-Amphidinium_carterae.1